MYVHSVESNKCDVGARGLVVRDDVREGWRTVSLPHPSSELPPCKGRVHQEIEILPVGAG